VQVPPAGHAAATAHLLGQRIPRDAAHEDEDVPGRQARSGMRGGRSWVWVALAATAAR
jgi:hypothetical protein